ncbi:hypothetical protein AGMMS49938_15610 [Fibrobacterales bacterium]|nr:hypothetical protein AGMMS49938_15610 [Fibrobacterales bacterium]
MTITCENFRYGEEKGFDLYYDELTNNADGYLTQKDGKSITIFPLSTGDTLLSEATYNMCKPITNGGLNIPSQNNLGVQCDGAFFTAPAQKEEDEIGCWAF